MQAALGERDAAIRELREAHDEIKTDLHANTDDLAQTKHELEAILSHKATLEGSLGATLARIRELETELHVATAGRAQAAKQAQSYANELDRVRSVLEKETREHHDAEESLRSNEEARSRYEQELQRLSQELKGMQAELAAEQQLRKAAEEHACALALERDDLSHSLKMSDTERKQLEDGRTENIRKLKEDFEQIIGLQRTLEDQVTALKRDKLQAEEKAASLAAEIDQARAALADEWEDHMTDQERLAAVVEQKQHLEDSAHPTGETEPAKAKRRALIMKGPEMPAEIRAGPHALANVNPLPVHEHEVIPITSVEDLFEDDAPVVKKSTVEPAPPIPLGPAVSDEPDTFFDAPPKNAEDGESGPEGDQPFPGDEDEEFDDDEEDAGEIPEDTEDTLPANADTAFNRAQWLGLLKWSHHCDALPHDQRMQIVRMGRLIQKGRVLTKKQEEQILEIVAVAQRLGYRLP